MSCDWKTLPLEDCMSAIIDYRGKTPTKTTFGVPLVTAKIVKGGRIEPADEFIAESDYELWMRRGMPEKGDVVMTTEAPLGEVAQLDGRKVALAQRVITLRGKQGLLENGYLRYLLQSTPVQEELKARATGTTVLGIKQSELRRVSLTLPSIPEQKRIAHILGTLDDKIELNRRMNATLEAMARALFQSWFVDFDPVRRNAESGESRKENTLFPDSFQDSKIGEVPKGWEVGSILREADLLSGGTPKTDVSAYWNGSISWASAKDVSQCGEAFLVSTERTITELGLGKSPTKIIPALSTVVVARGATTGRLTMFGDSMAMNQTCYALRSKVEAPFALYCHARHFIERLVQGAHGSVFETITTSTFEATDVLLAPKEVLFEFDKKVGPLFQKIRENIFQSRTLSTIRDTLLPWLLAGNFGSEHPNPITGSHKQKIR